MTCYLGSRGQTRVTSALHRLATSDGEFIRLVGLSARERHETPCGDGPSTGNDALPLGKCFPEVEVLEVAPAGGVGTADRLLGGEKFDPRVTDVIAGDYNHSRSVPEAMIQTLPVSRSNAERRTTLESGCTTIMTFRSSPCHRSGVSTRISFAKVGFPDRSTRTSAEFMIQWVVPISMSEGFSSWASPPSLADTFAPGSTGVPRCRPQVGRFPDHLREVAPLWRFQGRDPGRGPITMTRTWEGTEGDELVDMRPHIGPARSGIPFARSHLSWRATVFL
jgi:hypothetical protein